MKVSLHRRRHQSLPPQPRRSPALLVLLVLVCTAGVAWGASRLDTRDEAPPTAPAVAAADEASREFIDLRVRAHLRALKRG